MVLQTVTLLFVLTMASGMPIALAIGVTALGGILMMQGIPLVVIPQKMFIGTDAFPLLAIPLFVLGGDLMLKGEITRGLIRFADLLVGRMRGGLAHATIFSCMIFAGITGSAVADASAIGSVMIPAMNSAGYPKNYSAAVTAAASIMGPIIPPSLVMVFYSLVTGASVGGLFMAGVVPGVLIAASLMVINYIISRRNGYQRRETRYTWPETIRICRDSILVLLMPIIIVGGILGGIFTATEAAGVGVVYALLVGFFVLRTLKLRDLPEMFMNTAKVTSVVLLLLATTNVLSWIVTMQNVPQRTLAFFTSISSNPVVFLLFINVMVLITGCIIDTAPAIFLLVPIFAPVAKGFGIDPLHFGIIVVVNLCIGLLTPPVGSCLFIGSSLAKISMEELLKPLWPFLIAEIVILFLITYVPQLPMTLPRLLGY
ncbi:MAG TPA: TRAP transporter large permease [Candidatus Methylomirabilis sp.]|jgi:tripartite ATP-independent transporter DctM subunit